MCKDSGFKHVQGFEFTESMPFNDDAIFILGALRRQDCVYVQTDDSGAQAIDQLRLASDETGYFDVVSSSDCHHHWIIISEHFEVTLMNPFEEREEATTMRDAEEVARLLELGDDRLLAIDGSCGGQNATSALSPEESAELYQACRRIAGTAN